MTGKAESADREWDKLFDSLADSVDDSTESVEAIEFELKGRGVDVDRVKRTVLEAVEKARAKSDLERAAAWLAQVKRSMVGNLAAMPSESIKNARELIESRCDPALHALYFSKLKQVASDADLQSLIQDLQMLELLEGAGANEQRTEPKEG